MMGHGKGYRIFCQLNLTGGHILNLLQNYLVNGGNFPIKAIVAEQISILETNKHNMPRKIGKILRIFDKVDNSKEQRVPCQFNLIGLSTSDLLQNHLVSGTNNFYIEASVAEYTVYLFSHLRFSKQIALTFQENWSKFSEYSNR